MMMKKKKKKQKVKKSGNTEKPVSDSPSWAEQQTKENEGSSRAHMESVDESVAGVVFCEEGKRKMKKKKRKDSQGNMDQQVGKPSCPTQQYNQHHIHAAGSTVQEERVKKKKNRKTDNSGNMEESVSEPPCQTFGDNQNQTQDDVGSSSPSICKHPYMNSSVTEPVGDPACSVAVHEEGVPKKTKKKRKRNNSGNGNNGNQEEEEQLEKGSQQQQLEVTDSSTCEKRIKKKKKAKRENSKITEEQITEPPSYTRQNRLHETNEEAGSFHSGLQGIQHLTHTRADNSVPEGGMKKKKKNKKKDKIANLEEQPTEPPFLILGDSLHQVSGEADSSSPGVGLEHVGNSASRAVICEEGMMKKKRQKADKSGNTEEHVVVSPSLAHKEPKKEKESSRTRAQPLGDSPSGMIFCEEGMRKIRKEKKKKRKRERQGNMEQQVDEPPSPTQQDSQQHIQDEADSTVHEGMKKKRKKSKSGKMEEQVTK
ncbi:hypothetical protein JZ751_022454 [Albula glossodonta]|uniref:Uncharacterized protein n=1 Tax=Albula glossodonta TaxID=121402 RepID=A0A8T2NQF6_9TELE|nr:hypothetical protein JZ751_022454 [Albula glossodonta]